MPATLSTPTQALAANATLCPFHDGLATLDVLLAQLPMSDVVLFDAALDLRSLFAAGTDADACVSQLLRVRRLLGERHYLAFYRVRCFAHRTLRIQARLGRGEPWLTRALPLDCARIDEVINSVLAAAAPADGFVATAQVRFVFASPATIAS